MNDYNDITNMLSNMFEEVNGYDFYNYIFPDNENQGEMNQDYSKPNAIYLYQDEEKDKLKRRVMLKDTWEDDYIEFVESNPMTLCGGLAYRGRTNKLEKAQQMNALIFDIDGVGENELKNIIHRTNLPAPHMRSIPTPTFIVCSGAGVHLYYVFDRAIALYPNIKLQLKALKYDLTYRFWDYKSTSKEKQIQYQSINQGFRMVGSINNKYDVPVRAFLTGYKVSLDTLNQYAKPEHQVDINKPFQPSKVSRDVAAEKWPEWYERVVVNKNKNAKKWDIKGKVNGDNPYALYDWWRRQIDDIRGGHRYFYMMCLCIYACKNDVPLSKLKKDMEEDFEILAKVDHNNPLSKDDMKSALETFSREYYNYTIDDIEKLTDIRIERNKRNGRKRKEHLQAETIINDKGRKIPNPCKQNREFILSDMRENGEILGRPSKREIIQEWRMEHLDGTKKQCKDDTGLTYPTIRKWWDM